jgi:hypothetical protein
VEHWLQGKGPSKAKGRALGRQRRFHERPLAGKCLTKIKAKACSSKGTVVRKSVNILFSDSHVLESWYGWVGGCCFTRESKQEDVAAVKAMD